MSDYYFKSNGNEIYFEDSACFTESEYNKIVNLLKDNAIIDFPGNYLKYTIRIYINDIVSRIFKLKDEWYILEHSLNKYPTAVVYYKCDQLDGLFKCLKDKFK